MREEILRLIEKNSRIDIHEMAILLGAKEAEVANAIADMENEGVICGYYTLIDWDKTNDEKVTDRKSTRLNSSHNNQSRMPSSA